MAVPAAEIAPLGSRKRQALLYIILCQRRVQNAGGGSAIAGGVIAVLSIHTECVALAKPPPASAAGDGAASRSNRLVTFWNAADDWNERGSSLGTERGSAELSPDAGRRTCLQTEVVYPEPRSPTLSTC